MPRSEPPPYREPGQGSVLVTGACGRLGKLLVRTLHRKRPVETLDQRPFDERPGDVVHHPFDIRRSKTRDIFRDGHIEATVHLGTMHNPRAADSVRHKRNVVGFQKLLEYAAHYGVRKVVLLSSANVYGPSPDNPQFLREEAPLLGAQNFYAIRDLTEVDMVAQSFFWKHPEIETVILRPTNILGRVRNAPSNYLRLNSPLTLLGYDPMVQPVHERDVVQALDRALVPGKRGIYNLKGPGELPLSHALHLLGRRPRAVPSALARRAIQGLWRSRLGSFPSPEINYVRYQCMVDDSRARSELGYLPAHDMTQTLRAVLSLR